MRTRSLVIWCMVLTMLLGTSTAFGQDFSALMDAVDRIETNLKQLVELEKQQRTKEIAELQATVKKISGSQRSEVPVDLLKINAQLAELKLSIKEIRLASNLEQADDQALVDIVSELAVLRAEISGLETKLDENPPQLVSTDPASFAAAMKHNSTEVVESESAFGGIEWSGFFDVNGGIHTSAEDETEFGLGQAEIDLASDIAENIAVEAAIAYNAHEGLFELGAAIIGINVYATEETFLSSVDISTGQFDVPFGVDYHVYPSLERNLVTAPSVVDLTHGGWNDYGVQFSMDATHGNFTFYLVNGFESSFEIIDDAQALSLGVQVGEEIDTSPSNAIGGRLGVAPFEWIEVGTSFSTGWNADGKSEMSLLGADLQLAVNNFEFKGEYISHSVNRSLTEEKNKGYYAHLTYNILDRAFVTSRYGSFKADGAEWVGQASIGAGYSITEGLSLRLESIINETSDDNHTIFQMVAGF